MTTDTATVARPPASDHSRAHRLLERNYLVYRRIWKVIFSGFFEPVFYLFSIGIGLGALVGEVAGPGGEGVSYTVFVAPALLAASAMNGAVFESTMNIFFKLKFGKVYDGMLTTPMKPMDIAVGEITWCLIRGLLYAIGFLVVALAMGLTRGSLWILALPTAVLIGFAFAACGFAATTWMKSWQDFDMVQLVTLPLFLFSATFYPLDLYPPMIQSITRLSPLYHGVELTRGFMLGVLDWSMVGHAGFLVVMGLIGLAITSRRLEKLLLT
ncbi:MAG TPA: ABC transporter permease [Acidimicrobiia bacterium]|nr:ABC transporter permease [Acidimicrobiia bacterium]